MHREEHRPYKIKKAYFGKDWELGYDLFGDFILVFYCKEGRINHRPGNKKFLINNTDNIPNHILIANTRSVKSLEEERGIIHKLGKEYKILNQESFNDYTEYPFNYIV